MSDNQYPPLPDASLLRVLKSEERPDPPYLVYGFTADQMRAYVDADRAQRKPLTDLECDKIAESLSDVFKFGSPEYHPDFVKESREAIRSALAPRDVKFSRVDGLPLSDETYKGVVASAREADDFPLGTACLPGGEGPCDSCQ